MSLIEINWKPGPKMLRQFAGIWLIAFTLLGFFVGWKLGVFHGSAKWTAPLVIWSVAIIVGVLGTLAPEIVRPIYVGWMALGFPIGFVVSHVVFAIVYFVIFTVVAIYFRVTGRDALQRKFDKDAQTYWIKRAATPSPKAYFNQF
ncbi:MAG: hypothetical protein QOI04_2395 [Verrucomicrobiota bacterium]|jgi:hypothetical protein